MASDEMSTPELARAALARASIRRLRSELLRGSCAQRPVGSIPAATATAYVEAKSGVASGTASVRSWQT